jgi:hypothetical protein
MIILIINLHVVIIILDFCISNIRMGIAPKDSKVLRNTLLLLFPVWIILVRPKHNWGVLWVGLTVNLDWIFISRKGI